MWGWVGPDPPNTGKPCNCPLSSIHSTILCTCKSGMLLAHQEEWKIVSEFVHFLLFTHSQVKGHTAVVL